LDAVADVAFSDQKHIISKIIDHDSHLEEELRNSQTTPKEA
jgi:hypothetical protein